MILVLIRRFAEMIFVLFSISVLVFMIFFASPGADPAARLAGRGASPPRSPPCGIVLGWISPCRHNTC